MALVAALALSGPAAATTVRMASITFLVASLFMM